MSIDLYYVPLSPPCRSVMMTAYMVGVNVNLKMVNMMDGEHMKPEYLKINPQHKVPAIVDDGFCLDESRAICTYLINRYGQKVQHLYPEDPEQRAVIDQLLNFDASVIFPNFIRLYTPVVRQGEKQLDAKALEQYHEGIGFLDRMLSRHPYAAGSHLTVADLVLIASVSGIDAIDNHILDKYPNIKTWFCKCQKEIVHYEELIGKGAKLQGQMIQNFLNKQGH